MVVIGSGAERPLDSIKLSRYACYLTKATLCYHLEIFQSSMVGAGIPRMVRSRRRDIL